MDAEGTGFFVAKLLRMTQSESTAEHIFVPALLIFA